MDITPDQIKTEPPEDADPYEEHTIELGEVKYENGHVLSDTEPLKYGELKVEAMLVVENGMIRPTDVAGLPGTVDLEPGDTVKEERDEFEEAEHADHLDIEGPTIKNEPLGAALEETEAQPGPSESAAELLDIEGPTIKNEPLGAALEEAEAQPGPSESADEIIIDGDSSDFTDENQSQGSPVLGPIRQFERDTSSSSSSSTSTSYQGSRLKRGRKNCKTSSDPLEAAILEWLSATASTSRHLRQ